jgi:hypothetical protein
VGRIGIVIIDLLSYCCGLWDLDNFCSREQQADHEEATAIKTMGGSLETCIEKPLSVL